MIKILHLYNDLMNLYGEWANAEITARALRACGKEVSLAIASTGMNIDFRAYDFIYIGSGTERSQQACMRDLARHREALVERIEEGAYMLATGNSHELFGTGVKTRGGEQYDALGLLDFETVQDGTRVTGDSVYAVSFLQDMLIGFINRSGGCQTAGGGSANPFERPFAVRSGPGMQAAGDARGTREAREARETSGAHKGREGRGVSGAREGIRYKNLLGTYLTGPVLVRNPPLLTYYVNALTGGSYILTDICGSEKDRQLFGGQAASYKAALDELLRR